MLGAVKNKQEVENKSSYTEECTVWLRRKCIYIRSGYVKPSDWLIMCQLMVKKGLLGLREARAHYDLEWLEKMVWKVGLR